MAAQPKKPAGPDLTGGIPAADLREGTMLQGTVDGKPVLVACVGGEYFAIGGKCTHYSAPLADGLLVGHTVRCPWHHACFSLRTGEALRAPGLDDVDRFIVARDRDTVRVTGRAEPRPTPSAASSHPKRTVIVGAGAAGNAAAEMLRRQGYAGELTMIGDDESVPYDRPNLSKDYLAGEAPEDWIPLRDEAFYRDQNIRLLLGMSVNSVDLAARRAALSNGEALPFDALLLAAGAEPARLTIPGADLPHVRTLRTLADSRGIIALAESAKRAVVIGAGFIGLEVASALRTRGLEVHVVSPAEAPLERVMGREVGARIRAIHDAHDVVFHLGTTVQAITRERVTLENGRSLPADLVVVGIGVQPRLTLAEAMGLAIDRGVLVNEFLETTAPGVYAAGDIARFPDARTQQGIRVEHWVLAQRHGQVAARNMLGAREPFRQAPFFWSGHFDTTIRYVGHAEDWDRVAIDGDLAGGGDCRVAYLKDGRELAVATIGRDRANLEAEVQMEENAARVTSSSP
jgi:NADPH-dependent 2,4-dienoyl-CoA reductase/sulfur reductase-like enzyme/nitrite reductase/ring-hydroxylating ferredoxin subunit